MGDDGDGDGGGGGHGNGSDMQTVLSHFRDIWISWWSC